MNKYRTHNCNELRKEDLDKNISISGWINKKRNHGNILFIDLRDNYGVTQCIIDKEIQILQNWKKYNSKQLSKLKVKLLIDRMILSIKI